MKFITHAIVLSCRRATFLIEKSKLSTLTWGQRIQLSWHLKICTGCKQYVAQSHLLDKAIANRNVLLGKDKSQAMRLSDTFKNNLQKKIDKQL